MWSVAKKNPRRTSAIDEATIVVTLSLYPLSTSLFLPCRTSTSAWKWRAAAAAAQSLRFQLRKRLQITSRCWPIVVRCSLIHSLPAPPRAVLSLSFPHRLARHPTSHLTHSTRCYNSPERRREAGVPRRDADEAALDAALSHTKCCPCLGFRGRNWCNSSGAIILAVVIVVLVVLVIIGIIAAPFIIKLLPYLL